MHRVTTIAQKGAIEEREVPAFIEVLSRILKDAKIATVQRKHLDLLNRMHRELSRRIIEKKGFSWEELSEFLTPFNHELILEIQPSYEALGDDYNKAVVISEELT